jgi:intracellular sulfur oxidation DsrE/DsrF family protein
MPKPTETSTERRSFLSSLRPRIAALAALAAGAAMAQEKSKTTARWEPARHEKDDWLDAIPGKHRLVFDTTSAEGFAEALAFAGNFLRVNHTDYGLEDSDLAVVIVARHGSTLLAYNDAVWAKYGAMQTRVKDPKTGEPPTVNTQKTTVEFLMKRGVQFAVCSSATHNFANQVAEKTKGDTEEIYKELVANIIGNSRLVGAGVVAVSRAQERGYALVKS